MANTVKPYANALCFQSKIDKAARSSELGKMTAQGIEFFEIPVTNTLAEFGATNDTCAFVQFPDNTLLVGGMVELEKTSAADVDSDDDATVDLVLSDASDGTGNVVTLINDSTVLQAGAAIDVTDAAAQRAFIDVSNKYMALILGAGEITAAPSLTVRFAVAKGAPLSIS